MRADWSHLEKWRIRTGIHPWVSHRGDHFGAFNIKKADRVLCVIASSGAEAVPWEHVSTSLSDRCPTWGEMAYIKSLFWLPDETVMQLHVPDEAHVNLHPYTLHLWRPLKATIPTPPRIAV